MKSTVSKSTIEYLDKLEEQESKGKIQTPYHVSPDAIDQIIIENKLSIAGVSFYPEIDLMLVVLNNKRVIKCDISFYSRLSDATLEQLQNHNISPMGVHWPDLDEDLSLRGFIKHELAFNENVQIG